MNIPDVVRRFSAAMHWKLLFKYILHTYWHVNTQNALPTLQYVRMLEECECSKRTVSSCTVLGSDRTVDCLFSLGPSCQCGECLVAVAYWWSFKVPVCNVWYCRWPGSGRSATSAYSEILSLSSSTLATLTSSSVVV